MPVDDGISLAKGSMGNDGWEEYTLELLSETEWDVLFGLNEVANVPTVDKAFVLPTGFNTSWSLLRDRT